MACASWVCTKTVIFCHTRTPMVKWVKRPTWTYLGCPVSVTWKFHSHAQDIWQKTSDAFKIYWSRRPVTLHPVYTTIHLNKILQKIMDVAQHLIKRSVWEQPKRVIAEVHIVTYGPLAYFETFQSYQEKRWAAIFSYQCIQLVLYSSGKTKHSFWDNEHLFLFYVNDSIGESKTAWRMVSYVLLLIVFIYDISFI